MPLGREKVFDEFLPGHVKQIDGPVFAIFDAAGEPGDAPPSGFQRLEAWLVEDFAHEFGDGIINGGQKLPLLAQVRTLVQIGFDQALDKALDGVGVDLGRLLAEGGRAA